jgi:hypothetical protein
MPSKVEVHITACSKEHFFLEQGYTKVAAAQAVSWIPAASHVSDQHGVTLIAGRFNIAERAIATDFDSLAPSPQFVNDIEFAVGKSTTSEQEIAMKGVLERWGHVIPTWVEVGSALVTTLKLSQEDYPLVPVSLVHV